MKLLPFILAVHCICAYQVANASKCKVTVGGIALVDHVMESFLMDNIDSCYRKCAETGGCESINFYNSNSKCELNSRTVENAPIKTVLNKDASHVMNPNPLALPKSCNERKKVFPASGSGTYTIDPDGNIGEVPYNVYCDMTDKGGVGVTVISHNRENWDNVSNCPYSPGSCSRNVSYYGASLTQLAKLTEISTRCEQGIYYRCKGDVSFIEDSYAWWVSRDGVPQYYWGGATPGSKKCACGMTNTCRNNKGCNCHNSAGVWRTDGGLLTDKTTLPVKEMRFADTDDSNENAEYYLAKLKCY